MMEHKFNIGDHVRNTVTKTTGEVLLIRLGGQVKYFIDPCPGAEGGYEWMKLTAPDGQEMFLAGNWFDEDILERVIVNNN